MAGQNARYEVLTGCVLDVLPTLAAGSVDVVVTDPPYAQTNEAYDSDIACRPEVWAACHRACGDAAALVAFAGSPTYHKIATAVEAGGWRVRQMWAWIYRDGLITSAYPREGFDRLAPALDPIVFATKGKFLLDLEREGAAWCVGDGAASDKPPTLSERSARSAHRPRKAAAGHWPRSVVASDGVDGFQYFALSRGADRGSGRTGHPNQKPISLMEWLVGKLPGRVVLDPFCGSASTGVAALNLGRTFLGVERNPEYANLSRARLADTLAALPAPSPAPSAAAPAPEPAAAGEADRG